MVACDLRAHPRAGLEVDIIGVHRLAAVHAPQVDAGHAAAGVHVCEPAGR